MTVFRMAGASNVTWVWTVNVVMPRWHLSGPAEWWPGAAWVGMIGIDGYYYGASQTFKNMFGPVLSEVRRLSSKPVLISESSATTTAGQPAKIADLFAGASTNKLAAVIWFDMKGNEDWQLTTPAALSAFRAAVDKYGVDRSWSSAGTG